MGNVVPMLRFQEFSGEWQENRLGDISEFHKGKGIAKDDIDEKGELSCIRYGELYTRYSEIIDKVISRTKVKGSETFLSKEDDVIIPASGESAIDIATASCVKHAGVALGGDINVIRSGIDGEFLAYYLNNQKRNDIARYAQGISVIHLYPSQLRLLKVNVPKSDTETRKITNFLKSLDEKLNKLRSKRNHLETYKRGVMEKIFSQELRFKQKDGSEFRDWEEKQLSEFLIPTLREVDKPSKKYLAIGVRSHMKGTFQKPDSDPDDIAMETLYVVKENDLVVNITFAWEGAIAIVKKEDEGGLVSHRFPTYTFDRNVATHEFFRNVITQERFKYMLGVISPGGAGRNRVLSKNDFVNLRWNIPCVQEQTKIAEFVSTLDQKIDEVSHQVKQLETFKKGLLQKMFI